MQCSSHFASWKIRFASEHFTKPKTGRSCRRRIQRSVGLLGADPVGEVQCSNLQYNCFCFYLCCCIPFRLPENSMFKPFRLMVTSRSSCRALAVSHPCQALFAIDKCLHRTCPGQTVRPMGWHALRDYEAQTFAGRRPGATQACEW